MADNKERYENHLPDNLQMLNAFVKLAELEGPILEEEAQAKSNLTSDQWIETATRRGLERRAKMLALGEVNADTDTEKLREMVLLYSKSRSPYTKKSVKQWLDETCGSGMVEMQIQESTYQVNFILELEVKALEKELKQKLREILPANMQMEVTLRYNTYGTLTPYTHGALRQRNLTYGNIKTEVL